MLQSQLSNGNWIDAGEATNAIARLLERESWVAARMNRSPMTTSEEVLAYLTNTGKPLNYGDDWYEQLRVTPTTVPADRPKMVRCDCGHECDRKLVMSASLGSSCPDCYDRMSD